MEIEPFNYPNPLGIFGGVKQVKTGFIFSSFDLRRTLIFLMIIIWYNIIEFSRWIQIRAEAAYLYDAVHLYANALERVLTAGGNPRNGTAIVNAIKGSTYLSAMG